MAATNDPATNTGSSVQSPLQDPRQDHRSPTRTASNHSGATSRPQARSGSRSDLDLLLAVVLDWAAPEGDEVEPEAADRFATTIADWWEHVGLDLAVPRTVPDLLPVMRAHYRIRAGVYDVARLETDPVTWPPCATAIAAVAQGQTGGGCAPERRDGPREDIA